MQSGVRSTLCRRAAEFLLLYRQEHTSRKGREAMEPIWTPTLWPLGGSSNKRKTILKLIRSIQRRALRSCTELRPAWGHTQDWWPAKARSPVPAIHWNHSPFRETLCLITRAPRPSSIGWKSQGVHKLGNLIMFQACDAALARPSPRHCFRKAAAP